VSNSSSLDWLLHRTSLPEESGHRNEKNQLRNIPVESVLSLHSLIPRSTTSSLLDTELPPRRQEPHLESRQQQQQQANDIVIIEYSLLWLASSPNIVEDSFHLQAHRNCNCDIVTVILLLRYDAENRTN
jgi:hypothetical protein